MLTTSSPTSSPTSRLWAMISMVSRTAMTMTWEQTRTWDPTGPEKPSHPVEVDHINHQHVWDIFGWIRFLHSNINWLVVYLPLWKIWKSVGMIIPNTWKNKKCSKPPTRLIWSSPSQFGIHAPSSWPFFFGRHVAGSWEYWAQSKENSNGHDVSPRLITVDQ